MVKASEKRKGKLFKLGKEKPAFSFPSIFSGPTFPKDMTCRVSQTRLYSGMSFALPIKRMLYEKRGSII